MQERRQSALAFLVAMLAANPLYAQAPALPGNLAQRQTAAGGAKDKGEDWVLYSRNYKGWRYSPLTQINKSNVSDLEVVWKLPTGLHDAFEATPIVVGGTMYFSTPWNHAYAVDAATGKVYWHYAYPSLQTSMPLCCGAVNRGVGVGHGRVVMATLDAHVIALDARSGKLKWDTKMADISEGYSATVAPQVIGDKVIVGISGGDFGVRGFIDAYDIESGKRAWRFWTIPGPGEPGNDTWAGDSWKTGGGPNWMTCTYEEKDNTIYAGIGNPGPDLQGWKREGVNLYTDSVVALDAKTGKLKWHFQTIPHDVWDLDVVAQPVIDDVTYKGKKRKVLMFAPKNGYFWMIDRTNGEFIYALPFAHKINWSLPPTRGKPPQPNKDFYPVKDKWTTVYPGASGGKEWVPVAYDPKRKRMYVPVIENGHRHRVIPQTFHPGLVYWGGISAPVPAEAYGHVTAIDVEKGKIAWDTRMEFPAVSGILSTASDLVVTGTPDQKMVVLDAKDGKELWHFDAPSGWHSAPMTYSVKGKQYIAFANGWGGWVAGFDLMGTPKLEGIPTDNVMFVFALPAKPKK